MLPEAYSCANEFLMTAGGQRNRNYLSDKVKFIPNDYAMEEILFDPQTSGGLLFSLPEGEAESLLEELNQLELPSACIGRIIEKQEVDIIIL